MGHIRLGRLPDTPRWRKVVALVADGADVAIVAEATMEAAENGLRRAYSDEGLHHAVRLLTQIALAAREADFSRALAASGISVPSTPGVFDVVGGFSDAMDAHLRLTRSRTDLGEMAQLAASESLAQLAESRAIGLFGPETTPANEVFRSLSTKAGFAGLAHTFFSRFIQRYLAYHLSRELSAHVGPRSRFSNVDAHSDFLDSLGLHSQQAALIAKQFAGGWFSKAAFEGRVAAEDIDRFTGYALTKIRDELRQRGQRDDA